MSLQKKVSIDCTECCKNQEVNVYQSINVDMEPGLRGELFAGQINVFECLGCGHRAFLNAPLMYHDVERKFVVQYYPQEILKEEGFIGDFVNHKKVMTDTLPEGSEYIGNPHIVFDMNDMCHCISFNEKISDFTK